MLQTSLKDSLILIVDDTPANLEVLGNALEDALSGKIKLNSSHGQGCEFTIILPVNNIRL